MGVRRARLEVEDALTSGLSTSQSNKSQQQHSINQLNKTSLKESALAPRGALQTDSASKLKGGLERLPPPPLPSPSP